MKSKKSEPAQFDVSALHAALESERISKNLNWKEVAQQSGVSASTLSRLTQGRRPDVDSLAALSKWLGIPADAFMTPRVRAFGAAAPLTQITEILRSDPSLNKEGALALEEMIRATYQRLRRHKAED